MIRTNRSFSGAFKAGFSNLCPGAVPSVYTQIPSPSSLNFPIPKGLSQIMAAFTGSTLIAVQWRHYEVWGVTGVRSFCWLSYHSWFPRDRAETSAGEASGCSQNTVNVLVCSGRAPSWELSSLHWERIAPGRAALC